MTEMLEAALRELEIKLRVREVIDPILSAGQRTKFDAYLNAQRQLLLDILKDSLQ